MLRTTRTVAELWSPCFRRWLHSRRVLLLLLMPRRRLVAAARTMTDQWGWRWLWGYWCRERSMSSMIMSFIITSSFLFTALSASVCLGEVVDLCEFDIAVRS